MSKKIDIKLMNSNNALDVAYLGAELLGYIAPDINKLEKLQSTLPAIGFEEVITGRVEETDTEWVIARAGKKLIILIPGTEGKTDVKVDVSTNSFLYWLLNRNSNKKKYMEFVKTSKKLKLGLNHRGFGYAAFLTFEAILPHLSSLASRGYTEAILVGHSYGAAVKSSLALFMSKMKNTKLIAAIGLGSPDPGRKKFQAIYSELVNGFEFVNQSDIVPIMPPMIFGWKCATKIIHFLTPSHEVKLLEKINLFSKERWQGRKGNKEWDGGKDHKVYRYAAALDVARQKYNYPIGGKK